MTPLFDASRYLNVQIVVRGPLRVKGSSRTLECLIGRASGCRVVRAPGVQAEAEFAFAGLHQLCIPLLRRLDRVRGPQHEASAPPSFSGSGPRRTPEIGTQLLVEPTHLDYHLGDVFAKLSITSRHDLDRALAGTSCTG